MKVFRLSAHAMTYFSLFGLIAAPARADWQYTKWGMTFDEVMAAAGGAAHRLNDDESRKNSTSEEFAVSSAPFESGSYRFTVTFLFGTSTHKLGPRLI